MPSKRRVLIASAGAVALALIVFLVSDTRRTEEDSRVAELEAEVALYTAQVDSLNDVVDGLNGRLNAIRAQMDSTREANVALVGSLRKVTDELKEYRELYARQQEANRRLRDELKQAKEEKDRTLVQVAQLRSEVDSLNQEFYEKTVRITRLESGLEMALKEVQVLKEAVTSVLVYSGTEEELKKAGYLKTWRPTLFSKDYRMVGFPEVSENGYGGALTRVALKEARSLEGELIALADRHGTLSKGKEYEIVRDRDGKIRVTFTDLTLQGQRVLAVLKTNR